MSCSSVRIRILSLLFAPFRGASCFKSAKTSANTDKTNKTIQHIRTFVPLKSLKSLAGPKQCNTWFRQVALDWTCWVRWLQRFSRKRGPKRGDMRKDMIPVISSAKMNWNEDDKMIQDANVRVEVVLFRTETWHSSRVLNLMARLLGTYRNNI